MLGILSGYHGIASPYLAGAPLAHAAYAPAIAPAYAPAIAPAYARPAIVGPRPVAAAVPGTLLGKHYQIINLEKKIVQKNYNPIFEIGDFLLLHTSI